MLTAIRNWVIRTMMKSKGQTGVVQTIPKRDIIEINTQITAQKLMQAGIDPEALKNADQVENAIITIESRPKVQEGIKSTSKARVFDLEGKEIKDPTNIMGGKEINQQTLNEELMKTDNPYSDLVKMTDQKPKTLKEREAEVLARMEKDNKEAVARIRERKKLENLEDPEDMAQGGRAGFKTGLGKKFLELLKGKPKKMFRSKDDVPTSVFSEKKGPITIEDMANISPNELRKIRRTQELGLYDETPEILKAGNLFERFTKKVGDKRVIDYDRAEFILNRKLRGDETLNELLQIEYQTRPGRADGGRIGYADGTPSFEDYLKERSMIEKRKQLEQLMREYKDDLNRKKVMQQKQEAKDGGRIGLKNGMDRRTFLKLMGGLASIPILGKFLKPAKVASKVAKAAPVVSKSTPPSYFFELAESIKKFGKVSEGPQERIKIHSMKAKDGKSELMLTEDIGTGEMQIKKISKENDEMVSEVQTMDYSPSSALSDESGKVPGQYDEYTEFNSRIYKDEYNEPDILDGIKVDEIIEEVREAPSIKKAGGGIARMLGE